VFDNESNEDMLLSNWHVFCGRFSCAPGEIIIQPGTGGGDIGTSNDVVARLHRSRLSQRVDAAIARLTGDRFLLREVFGIGPVTMAGIPQLGQHVKKSGRTTGVTAGTVVDDSLEVDVDGYPDGARTFRDQIVIEDGSNVSRAGDSGSAWLDEANRVIGLNFAGSDGMGIANPIPAVLEELNVNCGSGVTQQDFLAITHSLI
jgi:hypothetical protein